MRLPLPLVNLALRLAVRRRLARVETPQAMRAEFERMAARMFRTPAATRVETARFSGPTGAVEALRLRLGAQDGPAGGVVLYLHGGAYLAGSSRTHRHLGAALSAACGIPVVLPDYALAPERPFPAALGDARAAWDGLVAGGAAPGRIALAGDSAGGGLAAALAWELAQEGAALPGALCLFSPWADMTGRADSLRRNAACEAMLPVGRMGEVVDFYLQGADPQDPRASPALARFAAAPPALVLAGRDEALADDATALAAALRAAGAEVTLEHWPRAPHAWPLLTGWLAGGDRAVAQAGGFIRRRLAAAP